MIDATTRILGLAAYLDQRGPGGVTLVDLTTDVPGYEVAGQLVPNTPEWEAVRKRVRRDIDAVDASLAIVIEYDDRDERYRLRSPFFTPAERRELLAAAAAVDIEGLADEPVLGELGAAVADNERRIVLSVPDRVRALSDAIRARRPVRFRYHGRERTVDAYAIGRWRTHWYVVGREHEAGERRMYRLDRIETTDGDAVVTTPDPPGSYELPDGFDAVDEMRLDPNDWGPDPLVAARVRVDKDHVHNFQHELGGRVTGRSDDACVVELDVRHYASFRERVLGFREHATVVAPPELVEFVRGHLAAVAGAQ